MSTLSPVRPRVRFRPAPPRLTLRRLAVLLAAAAILFAAWLYLRSSSLVAIRQVQITGVTGADAGEIRATLRNEAVTMTTLDVSGSALEGALAGYPHIAGVRVATHFPHGLTVVVDEQVPLAAISAGSSVDAVDGTGLLLPREATAGLPRLPIAPAPSGRRVTAAGTLATLSVLAAAPYQLITHIASARSTDEHGVTLQLRDGPALYFGNTNQLGAKWSAAVASLADANSAGAAYIDLSAPDNPSAGTNP